MGDCRVRETRPAHAEDPKKRKSSRFSVRTPPPLDVEGESRRMIRKAVRTERAREGLLALAARGPTASRPKTWKAQSARMTTKRNCKG